MWLVAHWGLVNYVIFTCKAYKNQLKFFKFLIPRQLIRPIKLRNFCVWVQYQYILKFYTILIKVSDWEHPVIHQAFLETQEPARLLYSIFIAFNFQLIWFSNTGSKLYNKSLILKNIITQPFISRTPENLSIVLFHPSPGQLTFDYHKRNW